MTPHEAVVVWSPQSGDDGVDDGDDDDGNPLVGGTSPDTHANELVFPSEDRRLP